MAETHYVNPFESIEYHLLDIKEKLNDLEGKINIQKRKKFVSALEFAKINDIARITVYRQAAKGILNSKKIGSRLLIEVD